MDRRDTSPARLILALGVIAAGAIGWVALPAPAESTPAQQSNFMGGNPELLNSEEIQNLGGVLRMLVAHSDALDSEGLTTLRLRFPAGVRSNWHTHTDGQLLMVEDGIGLHQVRGQAIEAREPGDAWWTDAGVEHWHGAHPDQDVVQLTIYSGEVDWMDPVTDQEYRAPEGD
ncbi:MAG: cupin domain-containing protein [Longimicrobiales bacterium]|nr:cupin domain-containing protein [Longimicrobiales bacterium]